MFLSFLKTGWHYFKTMYMKNILFFIAVFCYGAVYAQESYDSVYMKNGDINVGKVAAINDSAISFTYKGETLEYNFKKADMSRIIFASGRVQNFESLKPITNTIATTNTKTSETNVDHRNKVAILPFGFLSLNQQNSIEWGYKAQEECYTYLNKSTTFSLQDPSNTNALLGTAGISFENIRNFTNQQLCNLLGVEYIIRGTVTTNAVSLTSSGSASYNEKTKNGSDKKGNNSKTSGNVYSSTSTQQNYKTSVLMEIYKDTGDKIFGRDRDSFWSTLDAYKSTIQYLLKKSPLYNGK